MTQNKTKALKFYNLSSVYEDMALYPALAMKYLIMFENCNFKEYFTNMLFSFKDYFSFTNPGFSIMFGIFILYILFLISLKMQKNQ